MKRHCLDRRAGGARRRRGARAAPGRGARAHRHAGLCHSDVSVIDGTITFPPPVVLGHEGAGVVEEVGSAVTKVKVGDHVVLTTLGNCGRCAACDRGQPTHCRDTMGRLSRPFTVGGEKAFSFANTGVFTERSWSRRPRRSSSTPRCRSRPPASSAARSSPAAGAVLNRAKVQPGQTVAVIGAGGIGQSTIQAARIAAAGRIVVIDTNPDKEAVSRRFGATDFVDAVGRRHRRRRQGPGPARRPRPRLRVRRPPRPHPPGRRPPRLGRHAHPARRPEDGHRGQLRGQHALQRQVDPRVPLRLDPAAPRHPPAGLLLQGRPPAARRHGQPGVPARPDHAGARRPAPRQAQPRRARRVRI